ncbi:MULTISPECIES: FecR family protein [Olivibacter]|jgi:ferric-dicitrate binding protein FerR (iron transport regulator)|uniref:FecR family protein n=1 Tax=Olivibacter oleidegradans TaxID=760123 RepID=A0ABV6HPK3_9SPHI|nr:MULTISPECIES: FecR family protein [Olivibacter]MDM8173537.1 FecR domain-containing protein [Olivibacter sp. 47]
MNSASERFYFLLNRFLNKSIHREELDELLFLLDTLPKEEIDQVLQAIYEETLVSPLLAEKLKSEEMLKQILGKKVARPISKRHSLSLYVKLAATAAVLAGLAFGVFILQQKNKPLNLQTTNTAPSKESDILPGGNKATLRMADGTTIILNDSPNGLLANEKGISIKKIADGELIIDAGTIKNDETPTQRWNTVATPRGGQYQIRLPDGSKVWLNAASSLRFPSQFHGNERKVELSGEAYFEIAKHSNKAFKVISRHLEVHVLGTDFNLLDYDNETVVKTTLVNGAVKIKRGTQAKLLKPGQQALLHRNETITITDHADIESEIAWKNGVFIFKDASIQHVMEQVARWYDIEVEYTGVRSKKLLNGSVSRNVNLSELMNMLAYTGVNYEIRGRKVLIKN